MLVTALRNLKASYRPLNRITLNLSRLNHNYFRLDRLAADIRVAPVLKSNAYGHGLVPIARIADTWRAPFLCVDSIYEGYELLKAGIKTDILIMGYVDPVNLKWKKLPFIFAAYNTDQFKGIVKCQPQTRIHLFVDTGMHREGMDISQLDYLLGHSDAGSLRRVEGVMSHLAKAQEPELPATIAQMKMFAEALKKITAAGVKLKYSHIFASGGLLFHKRYHRFYKGNIARCGIALYGINPYSAVQENLLPVLELKSSLVQVKQMQKGEGVGYDFTYKANRHMKIAVLPIGYGDGIDRRLQNKGSVNINGIDCSFAGRISMNIATVDITGVNNVAPGDTVTVFSSDTDAANSITQSALAADTIPYDLLVHLSPTIRRDVV